MLKYRKKGLCKTLSIILAAVMLLTGSIGITQAYALEDGQPAVTDVQGEQPLGTSEETETNGVLDNGMQPEVSDSPTDASSFGFSLFGEGITPPAFAGDYPKLGTEQTDGSKKIEVLVKGILPEGETSMGLGYVLLADNDLAPTAEQIKSARGKIPGVTVITWGQQSLGDTETTITLTGTQDDTDYDFYVVCWQDDTFSEVEHLDVKTPAAGSGDPGTFELAPPTGLQWDTADGIKAKWNAVENATSYDVTLWKEGHSTMLIQYTELTGMEVSFQSNIAGSTGNYHFTVQAIAEGYIPSLKPASPIHRHIAPLYGNVTISNMSPQIGDTLTGSLVDGNNTGTLSYEWKSAGSLVGEDVESYTVTGDDLGKTITLEITSSVETGTRTSNATAEVSAAPTVWEVKNTMELENAVNGFKDGDTIQLIQDINYDKGIVIDGKTVTFDVGTYTLEVSNGGGSGLKVEAGGEVHLTGSGKFNVSGQHYGVQVEGLGAKAEVTIASGSGTYGIGAYAKNGGQITVNGSVWGQSVGAFSGEGGNIIVNGEVKGSIGAEASGEASCIVITGNVKGTYTYGVKAGYGGKITVHGKITSDYQDGVYAVHGGEIEVHGDVEGKNGAYVGGDAVGKYGSIHITGNVTGLNGYGVLAIDGGSAIIVGDVTGWKGPGASCSHGNINVSGNVKGTPSGVSAGIKNSIITVKGNVMASLYSGYAVGAEISGYGGMVATGAISGKIIIDGEIKSNKDYIRINNVIKDGTPGSRDAVSGLDGYYSYSEVNSIPTEPKGSVYATSVVFVKANDMECEIGGTPYATLSDALAAVSSGGTITLLKSITHNEPVVIDGKSITFALGDFDLTIDTSTISNSIGLHVKGDGKVNCTGSGKFNVVGSDYGVKASGGSELHISGNITAKQYAVTAGSTPGTGTPKITVDGDVTVTGQDVNAWGEVEAVSVGGYATVTIGGNVMANRTDEMQLVTAVYSNASTITIGKNVTTQGSGVNAQNGGNVTIGGALHYNPTGSGEQAYIKVGYPIVYKTADDYEPTSIKPEYKEYRNGDNVVWIKEAPAICTIGAQKFTSLDAAIASVPAGGRATITMLQSITHTKHIMVEKKTINLDLMDYDLLLDTSANTSYSPALMVTDGGKVNLIGSGTGEFNIKSYMTAISVGGIDSKATVHNVVAGDSAGVNMVGSGDYLDSSSTVTVLGSITVGNGNGVEVNAKNGKVVVGGNITAGRIGVYVWSNPGTHVTVKGDITVDSFAAIAGIRAYGDTNVDVTGNVTVQGNNPESNCVGVHASGSRIQIDGNVMSSGTGVHCDSNGGVEITGSLTAGTPFITFGIANMTADEGIEMDEGYILYSYGYNNVRIGSIGVSTPTYTITVQNDGYGTGSASLSSAEAGTEIILTVTPSSGYVFKEWQVVSGGVSIVNNKFTMPAANVTAKAIFEPIPVAYYNVMVNGSYAGTTGAGRYGQGTIVTIHAGSRSSYSFAGWTSPDGVTFTNAGSATTSFIMPNKTVTVTANWTYIGSGGGGGSSRDTAKVDASITPKTADFNRNAESGNYKDVKITLAIGSYTLSSIKLNGKVLEKDIDYTMRGSAVTIKKDYLAKLDKGEKSFIFHMNGGKDLVLKIFVSDTRNTDTGSQIPFEDVTVDHWFAGSVMWAYEKGLMSGTSKEPMLFAPHSNTTRGMVVTMLYRLEGEPTVFGNPFDDVFSGSYYADAVRWAYAENIVGGLGNRKFAPDNPVTREQIAVILMKYAKSKGYDVSVGTGLAEYSDADTVSRWALDAMAWANTKGLIQGDGNKLMPGGNAERCQVTAIFQRFYEMYVK